MRLTDISVRQLPVPEKGQRTFFDDTLNSFGCRVSQGGTRSFFVQHGSDRRFVTIGRYPIISLSEARTEAKRILAENTLGRNRPKRVSCDEAQKLYLADCEERVKAGTMRSRTLRDYKRLLGKHFAFRKQMSEITSHDIATRIDRIKDAPSERNHALVAAKIFFSWAQKPTRRYVLSNPCEGMAGTKRPSRKRVLSDKELAAVYCTAIEGDDAFSRIVTLLILTGQRRGEIAALEWEWFETTGCTITLPETLTKNKKEHTFPYGPGVAAILGSLNGQSQYLFPATRATWRKGKLTTVFNSWGKNKKAFDEACGVSRWTLHDLRRTFSTNLAGLKVPPHIVERLINHKFGSIQNQTDGLVSAVAEIYNRHLYMDEMREAVAAWEHRLAQIVALHKMGISSPAPTRRDVPRPRATDRDGVTLTR